ncbi:MAG: hypothetical protein RIG77_15250 [Cyclobacteriaceae bacterium]
MSLESNKELTEEVKQRIVQLISENKVPEAMKVVMDALGYGLKEAKEIVDKFR